MNQNPLPTLSDTIKLVIKPSWIFRKVLMIHADRRLFLLTMFHIVSSVVIFVHFALVKFNSQMEMVPSGAPYYSWKIGVPTFEFGTMHAILFQLAILPLTMCRLLISKSWNTFLGDFIPFNEMTKCHIAVGYTAVFLLLATIVVFLMFFGVLCNSGAQAFCEKFLSEIIITGYVIFVAFMSVGVTSYFRFKIPYKVFYAVHHIVFIGYILTILHTVDIVQRKQGGRSQAFKWFSASLLLYICDRVAMYLSNRHISTVVFRHAIDSDVDERMVILKVKKPSLFYFHPGQYVYLKVPSVDNRWHPYSIGSGPQADTLDFYIKVHKETSWSGKLFTLMKEEKFITNHSWEDDPHPNETRVVEILGPYGVGLGDGSKYSRALIVGTGTGFVPCLSLLHDHISRCVTIHPKTHEKEIMSSCAILNELQRGSLSPSQLSRHSTFASTNVQSQMNEMVKIIESARRAKNQIIVGAVSLLGPILGIFMFGLTISWNQLPFDLYQGMEIVLIVGTILFQSAFLVLTFAKYSKVGKQSNIWVYVDFVAVMISAVYDWFLFSKDLWGGNLGTSQLVYYSLLTSYMIVRFISHVINSTANPIEEVNKRKIGLVVFSKVKFIWVSRSASTISQVYPDIEKHWNKLVAAWGLEKARKSCDIVIHCTDRNRQACQDLVDALQSTDLFKEDCIRFGRPSFEALLDQNTAEIIGSSEYNIATRTMFAFCGSGLLGRKAKEANQFNDMFLSMTGYTQHVVDMEIHTYGEHVPEREERESLTHEESNEGSFYNIIVPNRMRSIDARYIRSREASNYILSTRSLLDDKESEHESEGDFEEGLENKNDLAGENINVQPNAEISQWKSPVMSWFSSHDSGPDR